MKTQAILTYTAGDEKFLSSINIWDNAISLFGSSFIIISCRAEPPLQTEIIFFYFHEETLVINDAYVRFRPQDVFFGDNEYFKGFHSCFV